MIFFEPKPLVPNPDPCGTLPACFRCSHFFNKPGLNLFFIKKGFAEIDDKLLRFIPLILGVFSKDTCIGPCCGARLCTLWVWEVMCKLTLFTRTRKVEKFSSPVKTNLIYVHCSTLKQ